MLGIADMPAAHEAAGGPIEVWDVHWNAFAVFRACATQWRVAGAGSFAGCVFVHLGLDYPAVEVVMRRLLPPDVDADAVFADLLVMEAEVLPILNAVPA